MQQIIVKEKYFFTGLIGLEICFFTFDVTNHLDSHYFRYFSPLNLRGFTGKGLNELGIKYLLEPVGNQPVVQVIKWELDDPNHHAYIVETFNYTASNMP